MANYADKELNIIKRRYNGVLKRNEKAEAFFKNSSVDECIKYLDLFNEVAGELSGLIEIIEGITCHKMDHETILRGFREA